MFFKKGLLIIGYICCLEIAVSSLEMPKIASANSLRESYNPPVNRRRIAQKRTLGSGSRSNCQSPWRENSLTLLIPEAEVVHYTASDRPIFYVYAKKSSPTPLTFNLVSPEDYSGIPVAEKTIVIERAGINKITLPSGVGLETDKVYFWQMGVPCNSPPLEDRPQQFTQVVRGAIMRVEANSSLTQELLAADSPLEKAQIYARNGIWYDALNLAQKESTYFRQLLIEATIDVQELSIVKKY